MEIVFSGQAERELDEADSGLREFFIQHAEKIASAPMKRHLRYGLPFFAENVTRQARIVYNIENGVCYILHCFKTHKEYERWYKSFK